MNNTLLTILKVLASLGSAYICVSPLPSMCRVYKTRDTGEMQLLPLVSMFNNYHILTLYGLFINDIFPLTTTTVFGQIMALVYITIFLLATADRRKAAKLCGLGAVPVTLFTVYAVLAWTGVTGQSNASTGDVFGYISLLVSIGFYASPFATIREVLRLKNAASIPIALCTAGTIGNTFWMLYGLAQSDWFIFLPNVVCVLIGITQILLYAKYNPNKQAQDEAVVVNVVVSPTSKHSQQIGSVGPSFLALQSPLTASGKEIV